MSSDHELFALLARLEITLRPMTHQQQIAETGKLLSAGSCR
jgi:hypothetical protein